MGGSRRARRRCGTSSGPRGHARWDLHPKVRGPLHARPSPRLTPRRARAGIWPPASDGTDVNAVCRSASGRLLATADDFGKVKLFKYPCVTPGARFREYPGHSSHVTNVCFTDQDDYVVSAGGNDRSLFQFRIR